MCNFLKQAFAFRPELFAARSCFPLHRFIPSRVRTGACVALCPCEASITCPSPTSWSGLQPAAIHAERAVMDGWTSRDTASFVAHLQTLRQTWFNTFDIICDKSIKTNLGCGILSQTFCADAETCFGLEHRQSSMEPFWKQPCSLVAIPALTAERFLLSHTDDTFPTLSDYHTQTR